MKQSIAVFDRRAVRRHRDRAAAGFAEADFVKREVADRLHERLDDLRRRFPLVLDLGAHDGTLARLLHGDRRIGRVVSADLSPAMARRAARHGPALAADEEALPFAGGVFDAVFSCLSLHWVNDLPGALLQIRRVLKPDGLFLAAIPGGDTLAELRESLAAAEIERRGGLSPRVAPFAGIRDAGSLLQRAGFALPVVDSDRIRITHPNALALMRDLRRMGETNAVAGRARGLTPPALLLRAAAIHAERHGGPDGRVPACFQILWLTGWAPAAGQQTPLRPGGARRRLADALGSAERPAGDRP